MRKCKNCKSEVSKEMKYCFNCGSVLETDYKSDLNDAMNELFNEPTVQKRTLSQMKYPSSLFSFAIIVFLVVVIAGIIMMIGMYFVEYKAEKIIVEQPKIVEKEKTPNQPVIEVPEKNEEIADQLTFTAQLAEGVSISKIDASKENDQIKLTTFYQAQSEVDASMVDENGKTLIGPISLGKGGSFYFLLNQMNKDKYFIQIIDKTTSKESLIILLGKDIQKAIQ